MGRHNEQAIRNKYLSDIKNGVALECGAVDGIFQSLTYQLYKYGNWKTYNFEANDLTYAELVKNRKGDVNINLALSNEIGESEIHIPKGPTRGFKSTVGSLNKEFIENKKQEFITQKVKTITFDKFIEDYSVEKIDFMVLDVEGFEYEVVERFQHTTVHPKVLLIEVAHLDKKKELLDLLEDLNYIEDKSINVGSENKLYIKK